MWTRNKHQAGLTAGMLLFAICAVDLPRLFSQERKTMTIRFHETTIRKFAVRRAMPTFPQNAVKRGASGVVVIELQIDEQGLVEKSRILQTPDEEVANATQEAVRHWEFKPQTVKKQPIKVIGKLTFYFVIQGNKSRVLNPEEMPMIKK